jgi:DNA-binding NarL/FixJ family response regulator
VIVRNSEYDLSSTMITEKLAQLAELKAKVAELEKQAEAAINAELAALPGHYGFPDAKSFLAAVSAASGSRSGRRGRPRGVAKKSTGKGNGRKRKRAMITDATRAEVKKLVDAGKIGNEIAKALGISLPSVQNIKKALGLVKSPKKKSS